MTVDTGDVTFGLAGSVVVYMVYRSASRRYMRISSKVSNTVKAVGRAPRVLSSAVYKSARVSCKLVGRATRILPRRMDVIEAHLADLCRRTDTPFSKRLSSYLESASDIKSDFRELYMYLYKGKKFDNPLISLLHQADEIDSEDILGEVELARIEHCYANDDRMVEAVLRELAFRDNPVKNVLVINHDLSVSCVSEKPSADYLFPKSVSTEEIDSLSERSICFGNVRITDEQMKLARTLRKHMVTQDFVFPAVDETLNVNELKTSVLSFLGKFKSKLASNAPSSSSNPRSEETEMDDLAASSKQTVAEDCANNVTDIAGIELSAEETANVTAASGLLVFVANPVTILAAVVSSVVIGGYLIHRQMVRNHAKEVDEAAAAIAEYDMFAHFIYAVSCAYYNGEMPATVKTAICRRINNNLVGYSVLCDDYQWLNIKDLQSDTSEASNIYSLIDEYCSEFKLNSMEFEAYDLKNNKITKVKTCVVPLYYPTLRLNEIRGCTSLQLALSFVLESTDSFLTYLGLGFAPSAHVLSNFHHGYRATYNAISDVSYEKNMDHYIQLSDSLIATHRYQVTPSVLFGDSQLVANGKAELPNVKKGTWEKIGFNYFMTIILPPVGFFMDRTNIDVTGHAINSEALFSDYLEKVALTCDEVYANVEKNGILDMARHKALGFSEYALGKISI